MTEKKKTLGLDEIVTERQIGRRSVLGIVGGTLVVGAAATVVGAAGGRASAQNEEQLATDSDSGPNSDPAGRGRTGHSDRDSGSNGDRAGHGVCCERGVSDSDGGAGSDPAGCGRGPCR
jgi:hypothetical protein